MTTVPKSSLQSKVEPDGGYKSKRARTSDVLRSVSTVLAYGEETLESCENKTPEGAAKALRQMKKQLRKVSEAVKRVQSSTQEDGGRATQYAIQRIRVEDGKMNGPAAPEPTTVKDKTKRARSALQDITNFLDDAQSAEKRAKSNRLSFRGSSIDDAPPPPPVNGKTYTAIECAKVLAEAESCIKAINFMMKKKWVLCSKAHLYRLRDKYKKDPSSIRSFGDKGAPAIVTRGEVLAIHKKATTGGNTLGHEDMKDLLSDSKKKKAETKGFSSIGHKQVSDKSATNYMAYVQELTGANLTECAMPKTESRFTAENSLRSAVSFMVTVMQTNFRPGASSGSLIGADDKDLMVQTLRQEHEVEKVGVIHPSMSINHDDTTVFFNEGVKDAGPRGRLTSGGERPTSSTCYVAPTSPTCKTKTPTAQCASGFVVGFNVHCPTTPLPSENTATRGAFRVGTKEKFMGLRSRLTLAFTAGGHCGLYSWHSPAAAQLRYYTPAASSS